MALTKQNAFPSHDERSSPPVDSKKVQGRRQLHFSSFDDIVADAEKLVASPTTRTLGNWPLSQLITHLARVMDRSIDGIPFRAPWPMRMLGLFMKRRILRNGASPGFKLPKEREAQAYPPAASPQDALDALRKAVGRMRNEKATATHPFFGKLTHEEWVQVHLRHAEMHLSFAVPG